MALLEKLHEERYEGVFDVIQLTRGTALEKIVGVDLVRVLPHQCSIEHRHPKAETVLMITVGSGVVEIDETDYPVTAGDRLAIPHGICHRVKTGDEELRFISIQVPPIHDESTGRHDVEPCE